MHVNLVLTGKQNTVNQSKRACLEGRAIKRCVGWRPPPSNRNSGPPTRLQRQASIFPVLLTRMWLVRPQPASQPGLGCRGFVAWLSGFQLTLKRDSHCRNSGASPLPIVDVLEPCRHTLVTAITHPSNRAESSDACKRVGFRFTVYSPPI
jgi:hypothetical protein